MKMKFVIPYFFDQTYVSMKYKSNTTIIIISNSKENFTNSSTCFIVKYSKYDINPIKHLNKRAFAQKVQYSSFQAQKAN